MHISSEYYTLFIDLFYKRTKNNFHIQKLNLVMYKLIYIFACFFWASVVLFGSCSSLQAEKFLAVKPKNPILLIGHGMGLAQVYAAIAQRLTWNNFL